MTAPLLRLAVVSVASAFAAIAFGAVVVAAVWPHRGLDWADALALALPATSVYVFFLELVHIASRGRVFSEPWVVRGLTVAVFLVAAVVAARRRVVGGVGRNTLVAILSVAVVGLAIWGYPIARVAPLAGAGSDGGTHAGWAAQLIDGETTPTAPITGSIPNSYPWLFHAELAAVAGFTPGGRPLAALAPMQLLVVAGSLLGLFAFGRRLTMSAMGGAMTAILGAMAGGSMLALTGAVHGTPDLGGPRGTYVMAYANAAPPVARDLAFALFAAFLWLLAFLATEQSSGPHAVAAGVVLGLTGITSPEFFVAGAGVAVAVVVFAAGLPRLRVSLAIAAPAAAIVAAWLVPLAVSYARLGGFVDTTVNVPPRLSAGAVVLSWGLLLPLGAYGIVVAAQRWRSSGLIPLAFAITASGLVVSTALFFGLLGAGFDVIGRASRYWPLLELALAVLAAVAVTNVIDALQQRSAVAAAALVAALLVIEVPFPAAISFAVPKQTPKSPGLHGALSGAGPNAFTALVTAGPGRCVVAAPLALSTSIFAYTGYRLVAFRGPNSADQLERGGALARNFARIRWADIYSHIAPQAQRIRDNLALVEGAGSPAQWRAIADRYGVDLVVVDRTARNSPALSTLPRVGGSPNGRDAVLRVRACR